MRETMGGRGVVVRGGDRLNPSKAEIDLVCLARKRWVGMAWRWSLLNSIGSIPSDSQK